MNPSHKTTLIKQEEEGGIWALISRVQTLFGATSTTWPSSAIKASTILAAHPPRAKNFTLGTSSGVGPGLDHAYVQAARPVRTWNQP